MIAFAYLCFYSILSSKEPSLSAISISLIWMHSDFFDSIAVNFAMPCIEALSNYKYNLTILGRIRFFLLQLGRRLCVYPLTLSGISVFQSPCSFFILFASDFSTPIHFKMFTKSWSPRFISKYDTVALESFVMFD